MNSPLLLDLLRSFYYNFCYKVGISYGMAFICYLATWQLKDVAPIGSYYSLVWLLAFFFPGSAFLYAIFNLRVRLNAIEDVASRNGFYLVYFPDLPREQAERKFSNLLRLRFGEYYNMWELAAFSLMAGAVTFAGLFFLMVQIQPPKEVDPLGIITGLPLWLLVGGSGLLGALAGSVALILKRYRTFDIYPSTYLQVGAGLIVGTLGGVFVVTIWPANYTSFLAFATAFLVVININFLPRLLRGRFAAMTGVALPDDIPTNLQQVIGNSEAIESLNDMSLFSVAELVKVEPIQLYLNMPQALGVINGWIDEALLHYYFPTHLEALRHVNIPRFTQLLELLVDKWLPGGGISWRQQPRITGDAALDSDIVTTVTTLVASRVHHRLLGFLSENYRGAYFLPAIGHAV